MGADLRPEPEGDALRAFTLLAAARAARDKEKEEARLLMLQKRKEDARKLAIAQGRLAPAGSFIIYLTKGPMSLDLTLPSKVAKCYVY